MDFLVFKGKKSRTLDALGERFGGKKKKKGESGNRCLESGGLGSEL